MNLTAPRIFGGRFGAFDCAWPLGGLGLYPASPWVGMIELSGEVGVMTTPITQRPVTPKSTQSAWLVLAVGTLVTFFLGVASQLAVFVGLGLCMDEDPNLCDPGTYPTTAENLLATIPTYVLWVTPALAAVFMGYRVVKSGNPSGRAVMITAGVFAALVTVVATLMWWI
jgi:hypothetical protein